MSLRDKVVLVTGGSRGIGSGIVRSFAAKGACVAFSYASKKENALALQTELLEQGFKVFAIEMQVQNRDSIRSAISAIKNMYGNVDVLINNAAISQEKSFLTITDDDWAAMMHVNLQGPFALAQEVLPDMLEKRWGRIINITSIGGQIGGMNQIHYASAKAGLIGLTRSLARVYSSDGVTCNAIAPGLVATDMAQRELESEAGRKKVAAIPAGRIGTVADIADSCVFLSSDSASYITGQTLNLNGGMYFG